MTDEQIIAAAGKPVEYGLEARRMCHGDDAWSNWQPCTTEQARRYAKDRTFEVRNSNLYTADAILSAAKPLRDRIASLEAEVEQWKCNSRENKIIAEQAERRNAELTKQRDGAIDDAERWRFIELHWSAADIRNNKDGSFKSMTITFKSEQLSDQINRDKLCRGFDAAIAAHKTGGPA